MPTRTYQENDGRISASLLPTGLTPSTIEELIEHVHSSSNRDFVYQACTSNDDTKVILAVAIVLAGKLKGQDDNLSKLLDYIHPRIQELDPESQGMYWHIRGYSSWKWNNTSYPALQFLNLSLENLKSSGSSTANFYSARVHDTLGQIAYSDGHFKEAEEDYGEALKIREEFDDQYGKALTFGNLGRLHMETGNFAAAYDYFSQDLKIIKSSFPEMTRIQIQLLSHLGSCLIEQKKLDEAKVLLKQSQDLAESHQEYVGQFFASLGFGRIAIVEKQIERAEEYRDTAQDLAHNHFEGLLKIELTGLINHLNGLILAAKAQYPKALVAFESAFQQYESSPNFSQVQRAQLLVDYAAAAANMEENGIVASLLQQALQYLDSTSATELRQQVEQQLKKNHKQFWLQHSIRRFTGIAQAEHLLEEAGQTGFRGEKCNVAILVSDIRDFTGISEDLEPGILVQFVNEYFSRMIRCVDHFEGYVDKIIGDAIMAIFTIPKPREDDAERAINSALMMKETLKKFNERLPKDIPQLKIGISIHFGKVVAGLIGSPSKRSYTILGDTVNTAFRVEELTKTLGVPLLVSEALLNHLSNRDKYFLRPLGRYMLRGRKEYVSLYEMIGEKAVLMGNPNLENEIKDTQKALDLFYKREFESAAIAFGQLLSSTDLNVYELLYNKAYHFMTAPPKDDWQGEIFLNTKA